MSTSAARTLTLSAPAWSLAVLRSLSAPTVDSHAHHDQELTREGGGNERSQELRAEYDAELRAAGLLDSEGVMHPDWVSAVRAADSAPVKATLLSTGDGIRTTCELALFDGLGLSVDTSSPISPADDAVLPGRTPTVVNLFEGSAAWEIAATTLPPFPELTSTEAEGADELDRREISDDDLEALERTAKATVQFSVTAPSYQALHLWLLTESLEEVRIRRGPQGEPPTAVLIKHRPGAVARQFIWDLLGAYQAVAAAASAGIEVTR